MIDNLAAEKLVAGLQFFNAERGNANSLAKVQMSLCKAEN